MKTRAFTLIELLIVIAIIAILALIAIPNFIEAQTRSKVSRAQADMRSVATAVEAYFVDYNAYPLFHHPTNNTLYSLLYHGYLYEVSDQADRNHMAALSTPVAYITTYPQDPFPATRDGSQYYNSQDHSYYFHNFEGMIRAMASDPAGWDASNAGNLYPSFAIPLVARFNTGAHHGSPAGGAWETAKANNLMWALISAGPDNSVWSFGRYGAAYNKDYRILYEESGFNALLKGQFAFYDPTNGTISTGDIWRF